jgi:hypothetical protein
MGTSNHQNMVKKAIMQKKACSTQQWNNNSRDNSEHQGQTGHG